MRLVCAGRSGYPRTHGVHAHHHRSRDLHWQTLHPRLALSGRAALAAGETRDAILKAYPYLEPEDIDEALRYAADLAEDETITLAPAEPAE